MRLTRSSFAALLPSLATAALGALPLLAAAHVGADGAAHHDIGFVQGLLHPFTGLDHLAAMVAVGLWSALIARGARDVLWAPLGFAVMLLVGAGVGLAGVQVPAVEPMIAASLLAIGLLVVTRLRLPGRRQRIQRPLHRTLAGPQRQRQGGTRPRLAIGQTGQHGGLIAVRHIHRAGQHDHLGRAFRPQDKAVLRRMDAGQGAHRRAQTPDFHAQAYTV